MLEPCKLTVDLFSLPSTDGNSILYAPRRGFACKVNSAALSLLANIETCDLGRLNSEEKATIDFFKARGFFDQTWQYNPIPPVSPDFAPTQLTLFPTNQCNLRCSYCYASAGDRKPLVMDWHYASSAIEYMIRSLKSRGLQNFSLGFHGGGEPLYPWTFIKRVVSYVEERCKEEGMRLAVFSATNGVLSEKQLEWIIAHFVSLNISFDGLPHVQDLHRPLLGGKGSFVYVDKTLRYLDEHNFNYGIRGTVSSHNVNLLKEIVEFIHANYKVKSVHLEPLVYCGRCKTSGSQSPDMELFADNFMACEDLCQSYGINLIYSGAHLSALHNGFCGVSGHNFSVTPDGFLTSCYEVTEPDDPRSSTFFFGNIDAYGQVHVDDNKRQFLASLTVDKLHYCQDCFSKWHCAGECAAKLENGDYRGERGNERCRLNRKLALNRLQRIIDGKFEDASPVKAEKGNSSSSISTMVTIEEHT